MKNILVTGVGGAAGASVLSSLRRSVEYHLIGVDADEHARGQFLADEFQVIPTADDSRFIPSLLEAAEGCDALFCTVDEELPVVAGAKEQFACEVFVSERVAVESCLDKLRAARILEENGIPSPRTWAYEERELAAKELGFPLIVKPVASRGGRDIFKVTNSAALDAVGHLTDKRLLVQEHLPDPEFTVDILADQNSQLRKLVARERVRTKGGVSTVARTVDPEPFVEPVRRILAVFNLKWIIMVQFRSNPPKVLEIGPRPAGTLVLSTGAGVNMPLMLLESDRGKGEIADYPEDVWFYRCDQEMVVPLSDLRSGHRRAIHRGVINQ